MKMAGNSTFEIEREQINTVDGHASNIIFVSRVWNHMGLSSRFARRNNVNLLKFNKKFF